MRNGCLDSTPTGRRRIEKCLKVVSWQITLCLCCADRLLALALPALAQTPRDGNLEGQLDS